MANYYGSKSAEFNLSTYIRDIVVVGSLTLSWVARGSFLFLYYNNNNVAEFQHPQQTGITREISRFFP